MRPSGGVEDVSEIRLGSVPSLELLGHFSIVDESPTTRRPHVS